MAGRSSQAIPTGNLDDRVARRRAKYAKYEKSEKGKARKAASRERKTQNPLQTHFGVTVKPGSKYGLNISRQTYATINKRNSRFVPREADPELWERESTIFEDPGHLFYTDQWCEKHQRKALENFDINMDKFSALDPEEFEKHLNQVLSAYPKMIEVTNLNEWDGVSALYIMVLDRFLQAYIGIASGKRGLKGRIRDHWSGSKQFDRLIHGTVQDSRISIDSFRALDTTRIFAIKTPNPVKIENTILELLPSKFVLNRIAGGTPANQEELNKLDRWRQIHILLED